MPMLMILSGSNGTVLLRKSFIGVLNLLKLKKNDKMNINELKVFENAQIGYFFFV